MNGADKHSLEIVQQALDTSEVPVDCVFPVRDGVILVKARNRTNELRNASRHAELEAIGKILAEPPELSQCGSVLGTNKIYHPVHSVYKAAGGYHREEAINAPVPKLKVNHVLKTEILPE
ncbi:hypothetical protein EV421DRAFT_1888299 [Armillaria borealis]|uniref:CMP/dCMP-type deaminase domain-containing protein n=1 Tax=Armillaria borealis TaxID=47425 RepID=A0AA39K3H4_9AGAR|nr:hypothetical protein EV421DRAFT_1888299 [Armillaria borealis]